MCRYVYFNRQSAFLWIPIVLLFSPTCFTQGLLRTNEKKLARTFNFMFCNINDALSINNFMLGDYVGGIYRN